MPAWAIQLLQWLETRLPSWVVLFSSGYALGANGKKELQKEIIHLTLESKHLAAELEINEKFKNLTHADIVNDAVEIERSRIKPKP